MYIYIYIYISIPAILFFFLKIALVFGIFCSAIYIFGLLERGHDGGIGKHSSLPCTTIKATTKLYKNHQNHQKLS